VSLTIECAQIGR